MSMGVQTYKKKHRHNRKHGKRVATRRDDRPLRHSTPETIKGIPLGLSKNYTSAERQRLCGTLKAQGLLCSKYVCVGVGDATTNRKNYSSYVSRSRTVHMCVSTASLRTQNNRLGHHMPHPKRGGIKFKRSMTPPERCSC